MTPTYQLYEVIEMIDNFGKVELDQLVWLINQEKNTYNKTDFMAIKKLIAIRYGEIKIEGKKY